jgi:Beta-lactamase
MMWCVRCLRRQQASLSQTPGVEFNHSSRRQRLHLGTACRVPASESHVSYRPPHGVKTDAHWHCFPGSRAVTVDHLLTHTCGGWPNDSTDPMLRFKSWDQSRLLSRTLENLPLTYPPGQHWAYSNFGYCVGRVIEKVSGQPYKDYVQQAGLRHAASLTCRLPAAA